MSAPARKAYVIPDFLRQQEALESISTRMAALDRASQQEGALSKTQFAAFPSATMYAPVLYVPQAAGIALARLFSQRVYIWFYSARVLNGLCAIALVFLALRCAPEHALLLMLPAVLPMSLDLMTSVSTDAEIIALSILFTGLTIRFMTRDNLAVRCGLLLSLILLTVGKPVYLTLGVVLLSAHKRLGWRRAILFASIAFISSALSYFAWSSFARPFFDGAGGDPAAQAHFMMRHPVSMTMIVLRSLRANKLSLLTEAIGNLGWKELPMPPWFYQVTVCFVAIALIVIVTNYRKLIASDLILGSAGIAGLVITTYLAGWVLWTPVGYPQVAWIQGRYFLPAIGVVAFMCPAINLFSNSQRMLLVLGSVVFLCISAYSTIQTTEHYFFHRSDLVGKSIQNLTLAASSQSCSATLTSASTIRFAFLGEGSYKRLPGVRVVFARESGEVLAEADPSLATNLVNLLPGWPLSNWRLHMWAPSKALSGRFWMIRDGLVCPVGRIVEVQPEAPEI